jgi:hypothetical protein
MNNIATMKGNYDEIDYRVIVDPNMSNNVNIENASMVEQILTITHPTAPTSASVSASKTDVMDKDLFSELKNYIQELEEKNDYLDEMNCIWENNITDVCDILKTDIETLPMDVNDMQVGNEEMNAKIDVYEKVLKSIMTQLQNLHL